MKKILITILATLFTTISLADTIDVIKHSRPGGLNDRMNEVVANALGDQFGEYITVKNCVEAKKVLNTAKNKVVTVWPTEREAGDQPCNLNDKLILSTFSNSPYHITYFADNSEAASLEHLKTADKIVVGVWDSAFWAPPQTAFLQSLNQNIKVVRYKSKPFRTALPSGEIDYKVVSFPGNDPVIAVLGENTYNAITGKELIPDHPFADMGYSFLFAGNTNVDVNIIYNSNAWSSKKDVTHKSWMSELSRTQQLDAVARMLEQIGNIDQ